MKKATSHNITVKGVAFTLTTESEGRVCVSKNGKPFRNRLEQDAQGHWKASGKRFSSKEKAVEFLAYWHTKANAKQPLKMTTVEWPDGKVEELVQMPRDGALQLTLWQIEVKVETARLLIANHLDEGQGERETGDAAKEALGKRRVYKAEIGLLLHRCLELMFKVLLGRRAVNEWRFYDENKTHSLTLLYDKLETADSEATSELDDVFQRTVMSLGHPRWGRFSNPVTINFSDGDLQLTMGGGTGQYPHRDDLGSQMSLMDMNSIYNQAYLGDAVQSTCDAYLNYIVDARPFLDFVESAIKEVVVPRIRHHLSVMP